MKRLNIVFLTGAGISVESGLSTFRGKNGMWNDEGLRMRASAGFFYDSPAESLEFYNWRRKLLAGVKPNPAHKMLAWLEKYHDVTVITQNVDNLHEQAGSTDVVHLHGELSKVCSSANPNDPQFIREYPLDVPIRVGDLAADGSQLRPFVVMFDEYVPNMEIASEIVSRADAFIVIGSSLKVYPAAILIEQAKPEALKVLVDPAEQDKCKEFGYMQIQEKASEGVKHLMTEVLGIEHVPDYLLTMPEFDDPKSVTPDGNWFNKIKDFFHKYLRRYNSKNNRVMKIKETKITDAQLDMVTEAIVSEDAKINLDAEDVRRIVEGRTGVMYESQQEGEERGAFMKEFFDAVAANPQVKASTHMLISLDEDHNDKLSMMDMMAVNDFMSSLGDGIELLWGVKPAKDSKGMSIRVVCMK